jgi:glycosyltransferase involved in cell wall biosynthesis
MTPMRIVFPHLARFPAVKAPAIQAANMAQAFAELGHHVTLVSPAPGADAGDMQLGFTPTFHTVTLSERVHRGQSYLHAARIARLARRDTCDLVFSRNLRACLLPARRAVPTVFEAHTLTALEGRQDRWVLRQLLRAPGFRGVVAISGALAEDLTAVLDVPADRILVAHDAVRLETGATAPDAAPVPPQGPRPRIGYTGSLFAGRGVELLLEVAARSPWLELELVGGPPEVAAELAARVAADPALSGVTVHGPVSPAGARAFQRRVDVLVAPFARRVSTDSGVDSSRWMSPMKVFEYMASGRPIVISDLPVLREVLRPDVDALMVPPEDPGALIAALERLRDDPELGVRLAASALRRVRSEFTWEIRARHILARFMPGTA